VLSIEKYGTFYFAEEGPGRGSEDTKKNVTSIVLFFSAFLTFWWMSWVEKNTINLKELH
jgi:hypothetical protein